MVALATAYNARETEGGTTKQELLHFVDEVSLSMHTIAFTLHTYTHIHTRAHSCFQTIVCKPHNNESTLVS